MTDSTGLSNFIHNIIQTHPEFEVFEIYNLAAQSHVAISFEIPEYTNDVDGAGVLRILEVIRTLPSSIKSKIRFYQAGTSEMGHAKDYVVGMWLILQQPARRVATARRFRPRIRKNADHPHIRREGIRVQRHRYRMEWQRLDEVGRDASTGITRVKINAKYFRPCEVEFLLGDATKAREKVGWTFQYDTLDKLIEEMFSQHP